MSNHGILEFFPPKFSDRAQLDPETPPASRWTFAAAPSAARSFCRTSGGFPADPDAPSLAAVGIIPV